MTNPIPISVRKLGSQVAAYVLNLDEAEVDRFFNGKSELDEERQKIFDEYANMIRTMNVRSAQSESLSPSIGRHIRGQVAEDGKHVFNLWRTRLGGELPSFSSGNALDDVMSELAIEAYVPFLIDSNLPRNGYPYRGYFFISDSQNSANIKIAYEAIMQDVDFAKLFSARGEDEYDTRGAYLDNVGTGGDFQLLTFPAFILGKAYELMRLNEKMSPIDLVYYTKQVLDMMRAVLGGEMVRLPSFIGVQNVAFDENFEIVTVYGKLRRFGSGLKYFLPEKVRLTDDDGLDLTVVLETDYEYRAQFSADLDDLVDLIDDKKTPFWDRKELRLIAEDLSLAFMLAIERDTPVGANCNSYYIFNLFGINTSANWNGNFQFITRPYAASYRDLVKVDEWCKLIRDTKDEKIRIAIRRVVSSVATRSNFIDGFVDAVIALECLFGGHAEVTLRISGAVAKLLHSSGLDRDRCQKTVSKLYGDRSKIVHGSKEWTNTEAYEKWKEVVGIVLECLRKLYTEHPNLIPDLERSTKILLS